MDQYQQHSSPEGGMPPKQPSDGLATASLVTGILAFFLAPIILSILAIIFAAVAKKNGNTSGKATAGLVLGIISLVFGIIFWVICIPMMCAMTAPLSFF